MNCSQHRLTGYFLFTFVLLLGTFSKAQTRARSNEVYVDKQGVLRWTKTNKEASFFGVNYTVPFAYGYRSHKALGLDIQKAIDADVYHMHRLGLDAFRVHIWDTEISDSLGNLLQNEHLHLFDYLISRLEAYRIKILITPIAFWGNGYPEKDERTPGFSRVYGKDKALVNENAIKAQENYVKQLVEHVNPFTRLSYKDDPEIIAAEINNEPHHSGPKEKATAYINRLAASIRSTGWSKPLFYNISESPSYAAAVAEASVQGHSFQWYPTGLVSGHTLKGNYLPNVDRYAIPFDTIAGFKNKAKMVYEFDAGDVLQSYMYPAMARSFRSAGFQWATQFAYDPMATAYANTEYQTHYLNLAYTPGKAISLLIASRVFHRLPRMKSFGTYPNDTSFNVFRVSYKSQLSEMNSGEEFYYSNNTSSSPLHTERLQHIAGVGSSPVVTYTGTGAYFLDKLAEGSWRLEVMPDIIQIRDPFSKPSPEREATRIQWQKETFQLFLADLGLDFSIRALNTNDDVITRAINAGMQLLPGVYLLTSEKRKLVAALPESTFFAPQPFSAEPCVRLEPIQELTAGRSVTMTAIIAGADRADRVELELHNTTNQWRTLPMKEADNFCYKVDVPADILTPGLLSYRIIIHKNSGDTYTFPGGYKGDPFAWNNVNPTYWESFVVNNQHYISLFSAADRDHVVIYNPDWKNNNVGYVTEGSDELWLKTEMKNPHPGSSIGWQLYVADKIKERLQDLNTFSSLRIKLRTTASKPHTVIVTLVNNEGEAFAAQLTLADELKVINLPLASFARDSSLLLPGPFPFFQPLTFFSAAKKTLEVKDIDKIQVTLKAVSEATSENGPATLEVESIQLN